MRGHSWFTEGNLCCYMLPRSWLPVEKTNNSTLAWQGPYREGGTPRSQYWKIVYTNHTTYFDGFYSNTQGITLSYYPNVKQVRGGDRPNRCSRHSLTDLRSIKPTCTSTVVASTKSVITSSPR